jgi:hypothetical protein
MAITKTVVIDQITIQEDGLILVRQATRVFDDDGTKIGERFFRLTLEPGVDVTSYPQRLQRIAAAVWTPAVIAAYQAARAAALQGISG